MRRRNAYLYNDYLKDTELVTPVEIDDVRAVYHLYVVRTRNGSRQALQEHLKTNGVSSGIHYPIALPNLKAYAHLNHNETDFPQATKASTEILSLPMYPELTEEQIGYICHSIKEFSDRSR
jgi:dTDP-4-amino-4,6-dideoxygalactose transaminase